MVRYREGAVLNHSSCRTRAQLAGLLVTMSLSPGCVIVTGSGKPDSAAEEIDTALEAMHCPEYSGLAGPRVADYRYNADQAALVGGFAWEQTSFPLTPTETEVGVLIVTEGDLELDGFDSYHITTRIDGYCDADGYWITAYQSENVYSLYGEETTQGTAITYSSPVFSLPAELEEGDTWTSELTGHVVYSDGTEQDYAGTLDYTVLGFDTIEVPAGSFDTLLVERAHPVHPLEIWLDPTIGIVADSLTELVSNIEYE